ncbi:MAG: PqqD family peptide modification chaperone [Sulfitobacter sp.]
MAQSFLSQDWYRVGPMRPRLRSHVEIHRQRFRRETWFIVQDQHSGKYFRLSPAANLIASLMDGRRSLQSLWETACAQYPDDPPTQTEVIRLLSQLHHADLIAGDMPPDIAEMGERHHEQTRKSLMSRLRNPLALRFPLFDPDRFLGATLWMVRWLFTVWGFMLWLGLIITGVTLVALNWGALTGGLSDRILSAENIALIALAYPLIKAIHELGHAYATKVWGGEVHEIGLMFLVFIPVPYVDASSSAAFPEKWRRVIVGGAGIMVELALAAIAMIVWINVEPGLVRAFAFNVMLIGGVSTLLFNGNPLLRFDGYFVLADAVEIPNLGQRSSKYFWYIIQRYLFGLKEAANPVSARGERLWFLFYSIAAFFYRMSVSIAISLFVAQKFFVIGTILAIWAISNVLVFPVFKGLKFLVAGPSLRGQRARAVTLSAAILAGVLAVIFAVPVPHRTLALGVVWLDEGEVLRASTEGFVAQASLENGAVVAGEDILTMVDANLVSQTQLARARLQEITLRLQGVSGSDVVQANLLREQVRHLEGRLALFEERSDALLVKAAYAGRALVPNAGDLPGRYVKKGAVLGYLMKDEGMRLRVAVPQDMAELVRDSIGVEVRMQRALATVLPAQIVGAAPESRPILPSPALSSEAGGAFASDPSDPTGQRSLQSLFVFDVSPTVPVGPAMVGERAIVRFDHGDTPLGFRIGRSLRQLFLARFNV